MTSTEVATAVAPAGRDVLSDVPVKALSSGKQVAMDAVEDIVYGSVSSHCCEVINIWNYSNTIQDCRHSREAHRVSI
jgi:hypothetical protein